MYTISCVILIIEDIEEMRNMYRRYRENEKVLDDMIAEIEYAEKRFPGGYHSSHEGYAILAEELDELWEEVKKKSRNYKNEYKEAAHVACVAVRYMMMCRKKDNEI